MTRSTVANSLRRTGIDLMWPKVEKRIPEIRKVLREHFGISAVPILFVENGGYLVLTISFWNIPCATKQHRRAIRTGLLFLCLLAQKAAA
jgi:hypothetical protein